jgi:hypothetical protein
MKLVDDEGNEIKAGINVVELGKNDVVVVEYEVSTGLPKSIVDKFRTQTAEAIQKVFGADRKVLVLVNSKMSIVKEV